MPDVQCAVRDVEAAVRAGDAQGGAVADLGDEELCAAVDEEVEEHLSAAEVEFGADVVDEHERVVAAVVGDALRLGQDEGSHEGFLLAARVGVGDVAAVAVEADVASVDAVAGVFELAVAGEVGVEEFGKAAVAVPAALVVDVDGVESAEFGMVAVEAGGEVVEVAAAQGVDGARVFVEEFVPGADLGVRPVGAQRGVAVFQGVLVALPGGQEGVFGVEQAVVGKAPPVFGALVDEGEVVGVDDFYRQEAGELAQVFEVLPVGAQAVFARGFFQSDLVFLSASVQAGDKAQVMFVVADDVAGLVFAEGFSPSEQVDGFE